MEQKQNAGGRAPQAKKGGTGRVAPRYIGNAKGHSKEESAAEQPRRDKKADKHRAAAVQPAQQKGC